MSSRLINKWICGVFASQCLSKEKMSGELALCSELPGTNMSIRFHPNHGQGLELRDNRCTASWRTRLHGLSNQKIAFSDRPILRNEKVYIRVMENSIVSENGPETHKKATFGFVSFNPAKLVTVEGQMELHDAVDLVSCAVMENLKKGSVYSFWLDSDGKLNRGGDVNNKYAIVHNDPGVMSDTPMWFMVKAKGNVTLKFVESELLYMIAGDGSGPVPVTYIYPDLANAFAHIMQAKRGEETGHECKKFKESHPGPVLSQIADVSYACAGPSSEWQR